MKKYLFYPIILSFLFACNKSVENNGKMQAEKRHNEEEYIVITTEQFKANDMALGQAVDTVFPEFIEVTGTIDVPPRNKASVSPVMGGYIRDFNLLEGDFVKKGETLFTLENPAFVQLQEEYLRTAGSLDYLKAEYERQKQLYDEQITSAKKYLKAKTDYLSARSRYHSLTKQLQMIGINPEQLKPGHIRKTVYIKAPVSGYITDINIEKGQFLEPQQVAMKVVNTTHKHVEMKVYEKDIQRLRKGQKIHFNQPDRPDKVYEGEIHLIGKSIDENQRTVNVHGHIHNEKDTENLMPGMFVEVKIATDLHRALAVPESALTDREDKHFVLVKVREANGKLFFRPVEVKTAINFNGLVEIRPLENFDPQAEILTRGAYFLIGAGEGGHEH